MQIKPWKLEDGDHTLLDLMPFLEAVYKANVPDVRDVVAAYEGQDIPTAFRYDDNFEANTQWCRLKHLCLLFAITLRL